MPLPNLEEFRVWLESDGEKMEEYDPQTLPGGVKSCWVASEPGKHFSIRVEMPPITEGDISAKFCADGVFLDSQLITSKGIPREPFKFSSVHAGPTSRRPLCFSQISLTDDERFRHATVSAQIGTIEVELHHQRVLRKTPFIPYASILSNDPVHEQSKKLGGHRIQLGAEIPSSEPKHCISCAPFDSRKPHPFLIFKFQYRPRDFLQAMGLTSTDPGVKVEAITDADSAGVQNIDSNIPGSSRGTSTIGVKPEPNTSENLGRNDTSELAKLRDQVARLRSDNGHLKKKLSKAKDSKKAHGLVKKEKRRVLGSNNAIDLVDSDPEEIVIDLCSDD